MGYGVESFGKVNVKKTPHKFVVSMESGSMVENSGLIFARFSFATLIWGKCLV